MTNKVNITMDNVPEGLDSMYVRVEEDALTQGVRNVLYSGVTTVSGNAVQIDIGTAGNVGDGVIVSADNYTSGGAAFKAMRGYGLIEAGDIISGVTEAWIFGASIEVGLGSGQWSEVMSKYLKDEYALDVKIVTKAWGGQWVHAIEDKWDIEKSAVTGRSDLLVITMPIGNNISNTRTWDDNMTPQDREDLNAAYLQFMNNITGNGNLVAPVNTTFRNYDFTSVNNESSGSLPYNENIIYPYAQSVEPSMFADGKPKFNPYDLTRNWYTYTFMDGDEIHLSNMGSQLMRTYYMNTLASIIKGTALPVVERVEDPVNNMTFSSFKGKCGLAFGYSDENPMYSPYGFSTRATGGSSSELRLFAINGHELMDIVAVGGLARSATTACVTPYPNSGEDGYGLVNDALKNKSLYVSSSSFAIVEQFNGLLPNQSVIIEILAISTAGTNPNYSAEISLDGSTSVATINSKWDEISPTLDYIHRFEGVADASGVFTLYARKPSGSLGCYINALTIEAV